MYDLKAIDEDVHIKCTGKSNNQIDKVVEFLKPLKNVKTVKVLPYHCYVGSKYDALNMENTLPEALLSNEEIKNAQCKFD